MSKLGQTTFILNLVSLRKYNRFTQEEISHKTNISVRKYQRLESGEATPSLDDIYSLAEALNVEAGTLVNHSKNCEITRGVSLEMIQAERDENALEFLNFLNEYFLPRYGFDNSRAISLDELYKDQFFVNHTLAMGCTNFRANVYNKKHGQEKNGESEQYTSFAVEDFKFPLTLLAHFNHILHMEENYYYFSSEKVVKTSEMPAWYSLGYVHRENQNYFAIVVKLKNKWDLIDK